MDISLEWLKDYVTLPGSVDETAERLTAAGLEVEGLRSPGAGLDGVLVAQVKEAVPHPNAEKLQVTQVDIGGSALLQIVCGAKNFKVGDKVPLATTGSELPNGMKIGRAALRGVDSFGMLCSAKELGLSEESCGLLILDPALKPGTPIAQALGLDDVILSLNVTPNRPDALNHLGRGPRAGGADRAAGAPARVPPGRVRSPGVREDPRADRGSGALRALRGAGDRGRDGGALAGVAEAAPRGLRRAQHQQRGGRHQLRAARGWGIRCTASTWTRSPARRSSCAPRSRARS